MDALKDISNFYGDSQYNKGAFDMAVLLLNVVIHNKGSIIAGVNQKQKIQFTELLQKYITTNWNATTLIRNQSARGLFNFKLMYDDRHNIVAIEPIDE